MAKARGRRGPTAKIVAWEKRNRIKFVARAAIWGDRRSAACAGSFSDFAGLVARISCGNRVASTNAAAFSSVAGMSESKPRVNALPHKASPTLAPEPLRLAPATKIAEARRRLSETAIPFCVIAAMCGAGVLSSLWGGHVLATMVLIFAALTVAALAYHDLR
jgi:hypothetical protein